MASRDQWSVILWSGVMSAVYSLHDSLYFCYFCERDAIRLAGIHLNSAMSSDYLANVLIYIREQR